MKLAIISIEKQFETERIQEEALKRKHEVYFFSPENLQAEIFPKKIFDVVLFRVLKGNPLQSRALALSFYSAGTKVIDEKLIHMLGKNKFTNYYSFFKAGLNIPKTFFLNEKTLFSLPFEQAEWIVVKELEGKRGEGVYKIQFSELHSFVSASKEKDFLVQEFIPFEKELRIMVIGGKALGAFEKQSVHWKKNIAQEAKAVPFKLTKEISGIAVKAAKSTSIEIAGVDLALYKKKWFVLETNRSPQFRAFEESTGINVAEKIVEYLEKKKQ
ncbi:RimK family alpha-L-glutamate ligase [Candidatus Micrarchaeota archaeon]|nr:RimK family alpha-L-glutamate ligase [Candidatus Micrarchaeota archaeon]